MRYNVAMQGIIGHETTNVIGQLITLIRCYHSKMPQDVVTSCENKGHNNVCVE